MSKPNKNEHKTIIVRFGGGQPTKYTEARALSDFYLHFAYQHASAKEPTEFTDRFFQVISTILFSTLALEAGANELIETHLSTEERRKFDELFRTKQKQDSKIMWKWYCLFQSKLNHDYYSIKREIFEDINTLASLRNSLTHYKLEENARKSYFSPQKLQKMEDDGYTIPIVNGGMNPDKVEEDIFERLFSRNPATYYTWARNIFVEWGSNSLLSQKVLSHSPPIRM